MKKMNDSVNMHKIFNKVFNTCQLISVQIFHCNVFLNNGYTKGTHPMQLSSLAVHWVRPCICFCAYEVPYDNPYPQEDDFLEPQTDQHINVNKLRILAMSGIQSCTHK